MSAELDVQELDRLANKLPVQNLDNKGKKPSRAATAFCLALAFCACERVPAALFYRACQSRRHFDQSGELVDSRDHLEKLPPLLLGLFGIQEAELSASSGMPPVAQAGQSTLPAKWSPSQDIYTELQLAESTLFVSNSSLSTGISLELLGIRPDDVQSLASSDLLFPSDLQYLYDLQGFATVTSEETIYFVLAETWKETILQATSEKLRIRIWTLLATMVAYAMPIPYTEPLWQVFQFQLKEIIESTVMPFLSVLDLRDKQERSYVLTEDILLLLMYHQFSAGITGSRDPALGPEISQYLRTTTLHDDRLTSLILLVEWLEVLVFESRVPKSNFSAHLESCSYTFLHDERLKFLILTSIDSAVIPCGCSPSAEITEELREWWIAHLVFASRDLDTISQCLWQSHYKAKDWVSVPALMTTNFNVKSALGFALAERQHYRQAQFVLSTCLSDTDSWPADSPTRHLLLTEFVNCSNLLDDSVQAESVARQVMQRSHMDNRFDIACLKIALADSYISQCKYKMAIELLTEIPENTSLSNDVMLRIALRLTKAKRRLAREEMPIAYNDLAERLIDAQENIPEPLRIEYLEEMLSVVVDAGRPLTDASTVRDAPPTNEAFEAHLAAMPNNWRVHAIRGALGYSNPMPFEDGDENTVNSQQLPHDLSQAWDESLPEPGFVYLSSDSYQISRELTIRVLAIGNSNLRSRVRGLSGSVVFKGTEAVTFVPSTINLSYQVLSGFSQAANIDVAIVKCNEFLPRYTVKHAAYTLRKLRIDLREAGFIGPIVALVPSLRKFDDSIVNTIDGGYGRGYDGYLEEPLEQGRLAKVIQYYCRAKLALDQGLAVWDILYSPLVVNHPPRMVLLPADQRESSAFADADMIPYSTNEAELLSFTLDYGMEKLALLDFSGPAGHHLRNLGYSGFVVNTQRLRETNWNKLGLQMVYIEVTSSDHRIFGVWEATLSVIASSRAQLGLLRISETLNVNLDFESKTSSAVSRLSAIHLSSKRMSECQVKSLEISRICIRRIIEQYAGRERNLVEFFAGIDRGHGTSYLVRYLVTGYRTYLDPKFTYHYRMEGDPTELRIVGDKVAAMQLCKISIEIDNTSILSSEIDIYLRDFGSKAMDSLQVHVGEPKWYVLWGPMSDTDELWPPSTPDRRPYIENEVADTYKIVVGQPETEKLKETDYIKSMEGDTNQTAYRDPSLPGPKITSRRFRSGLAYNVVLGILRKGR